MADLSKIPEEFIKQSDGCTLWPDLWYRSCCVIHDYADKLGVDKIESHFDLGICVIKDTYHLVHDKVDPVSPLLADVLAPLVIPVGGLIGVLMIVGLMYLNPLYTKFKKNKDK